MLKDSIIEVVFNSSHNKRSNCILIVYFILLNLFKFDFELILKRFFYPFDFIMKNFVEISGRLIDFIENLVIFL